MDLKPIVAVGGFVLCLLRTISGEATALLELPLNELTVLSNCWILTSESLSLVLPTDGFTSSFACAARLACWSRKFSSSMWFCAIFFFTTSLTGIPCLDVDGSFDGDWRDTYAPSSPFVCWDSWIVRMPGELSNGCSTWTWAAEKCKGNTHCLDLGANCYLTLPSPSPSTWLWSFCRFRSWIVRYSVISAPSLSSPYNVKSLTQMKTAISSRTAIKHKIALNAFKTLPNFIESCRKHKEPSRDQYWQDQSIPEKQIEIMISIQNVDKESVKRTGNGFIGNFPRHIRNESDQC